MPVSDTVVVCSSQAEAEEDCHSDAVRVGDEGHESPAERDLQACVFSSVMNSSPRSRHWSQLGAFVSSYSHGI